MGQAIETTPSRARDLHVERTAGIAVIVVAVVAAVALRWWIVESPLGRIDSDEGIIGLIALAIGDGSRVYISWGNSYGGTLGQAFAALAMHLFGSSAETMKLAGVVLTFGSCVLLWRIARYFVDERRARFAGALFLVYPAFDLWWSTKAGYYAAALVCSLAVVLCALWIDAKAETAHIRWFEAGALGLLTGLAFWTTPQCLLVVGPVLVWLAVRRYRLWRSALPFVVGAILGAAPWIRWNLSNDWNSLRANQVQVATTYGERFRHFFAETLPQSLGFRVPYERSWILWGAGRVAYVAALVGLIAGVVYVLRDPGRRRRFAPVLAIFTVYPFLYALAKETWYFSSPRYLTQLAPFIALLVAAMCATYLRQLLVLALAIMLAVATLASLESVGESGAHDVMGPKLTAVIEFLDEHDIHYVFADYWISYALTFETERDILASPVDFVREPKIDLLVAGAYPSTYLVFAGGPRDDALTATLTQMGVHFERVVIDGVALFLLDRNMRQYDFPPGFWSTYG
jgi:4-amino-4-deoxy-L-arabinose transferase-like glycosyltransferase